MAHGYRHRPILRGHSTAQPAFPDAQSVHQHSLVAAWAPSPRAVEEASVVFIPVSVVIGAVTRITFRAPERHELAVDGVQRAYVAGLNGGANGFRINLD